MLIPQGTSYWLQKKLSTDLSSTSITALTGDMGKRRYFRISLPSNSSFVLCVYHQPIQSSDCFFQTHAFLKQYRIPIPEIIDYSIECSAVLLEDLGDETLSQLPIQKHQEKALELMLSIHELPSKSLPATHCIRSHSLDYSLFMKEMRLTAEWFLKNQLSCSTSEQESFVTIMSEYLQNVDSQDRVVCHRDFHTNNILCFKNNLYVIDFQDMRMGFGGYDLHSILFEREALYTSPSELFKKNQRLLSNYRDRSSYKTLSFEKFYDDFLTNALQRTLKAIGSFSNGGSVYKKYIKPSLELMDCLCKEQLFIRKSHVQSGARALLDLNLHERWSTLNP